MSRLRSGMRLVTLNQYVLTPLNLPHTVSLPCFIDREHNYAKSEGWAKTTHAGVQHYGTTEKASK
jgi:hypothetical protein